ncbi:two-component response regulator-like APRR3 isoform X2 [Phragmites australis]|uniref:two-component response regulator-like APRR3 isoform X2 n=1 Tax=Phragmites australis TaxID=29695 RepID=UPI002D782DEC|nr:two-component response regulator-like APRR3 isoform X2 [Phragmites australis]
MSPDADAVTASAAGGGGGGEASGASPSPSQSRAAAGRGVVRWDQILPRCSLRVLLVEHDDSTRQVVTALLRKCGYRVAAVADGMKAWQVMRERAYAFDLVLTEVAMPTLSGIQLLARVVAADECKNIPVIMMSSQDSISTVLKCMQKGAVDFLVKPVRKNELRNLWQHVWRRHAMNSQINASENNAASNHLSANAADSSKTGENSDEESDGHSFGSKRETEIQSVEKLPEILKDEGAGSSRKNKIQSESYGGVNTKAHASKGALSGSACNISNLQAFSAETNVRSKCLNGTTSAKFAEQIMDNALRIADASSRHPSNLGKDLAMTQPTTDRKCKSSVLESIAVTENNLGENSKGAARGHAESCPSQFLEINLGKQHCLNGYTNQEFREKDIFNHSNSSAFSRYGNKRIEPSSQQQLFPSLRIARQEPVYGKDPVLQPNGVLPSHEHNTGESRMQAQIPLDSSMDGAAILCSSRAREKAGTSSSSHRKDSLSHPSYGFIPLPIPVGAAMPYHYGAILQPLYYPQASHVHCDSAGINKAAIQHASGKFNYHENHCKLSQVDEHKQLDENQQLHHSRQILRESGEPIHMVGSHVERVNQSASCSKDIRKGSGCTGSGETDINTNTVVALESGNESGVQNCSNNGLDSDRSRREAALIKFRMKRKDRCFEKKVRYHSRKKLAEQRPRVKGQFVSQKLKSTTTTDAETDS